MKLEWFYDDVHARDVKLTPWATKMLRDLYEGLRE